MWLNDALLLTPQSTKISGKLADNLLVSCNAAGGIGGLVSVKKTNDEGLIETRILDRLGTTGIWVEPEYYVRSVQLADHMMLILSGSWGATWVAARSDVGDIHDVRVYKDKLYIVSTITNEVLVMTVNGELVERITYPGGSDAWHINCLGVWDDRLVLSSFGQMDTSSGWRTGTKDTGLVFDLRTREILWDKLNSPHNPRQADGKYFVCSSSSGELFVRENGQIRTINFGHYWTRGLAFGEKHIYVGLSLKRHGKNQNDAPGHGKIAILDRATFEPCGELDMPFDEIYDIVILP